MNKLVTISNSSYKSLNIPKALHRQIKMRAVGDDISVSRLVSEAFELYCINHAQEYDVIIKWYFISLDDYELWRGWLNQRSGIYMYANNSNILYVGNTQASFFQRLEQHRQDKDKYVKESEGVWIGTLSYRDENFQRQDILYRQIEDYCIEKYRPIYNEKITNTKTKYKYINILEHID